MKTETFAATIEWYGPYPNLTAVHQAVNNADDWYGPWTDGLIHGARRT